MHNAYNTVTLWFNASFKHFMLLETRWHGLTDQQTYIATYKAAIAAKNNVVCLPFTKQMRWTYICLQIKIVLHLLKQFGHLFKLIYPKIEVVFHYFNYMSYNYYWDCQADSKLFHSFSGQAGGRIKWD
jgi:hypothetical protein